MRFIPTTAARVKHLKKQAKRLKSTKGGKHADLLNAVAKTAGYDHWHHVTLCLEQSERSESARSLADEANRILAEEKAGKIVMIMTGPEITSEGPLVLFSTGVGDAWLIDPEDNSAACLMWQGEKRPAPFRDHADDIEIDWDGDLALNGQFVNLDCPDVPEIGRRTVAGYPVDAIRDILNRAQSVERKMVDIFGQVDGVDLTDEVIADLVRSGWNRADLERGRAEGARYSPGRNSLLYPVVSDLD